MVVKRRDFVEFLRSKGAAPDRIKGSHEAWKRPGCKRPGIVPFYDELSDDLVRTILSALELKKSELRVFLGR